MIFKKFMEEKDNKYPEYILEIEAKLSRFFRTMKEKHIIDASQSELSMPQFFCLWILSKCGKLRMSELADNLSLSYASATNLINRLSEAGYVNRYDDPEDRRVVFVDLNESGLNITELIREKHLKEMADKCVNLTSEQIDTMLKGIETLIYVVSLEKDK